MPLDDTGIVMSDSKLVVVIATLGRPDDVADLIESLESQTRQPDRIVISVTSDDDLPPEDKRVEAEVLMGPKGLCKQRNAALDHIGEDYDYLVFFDDDYVATRTAVDDIARYFDENPSVVGITGHLIADGIKGPGIDRDEAFALVSDFESAPRGKSRHQEPVADLYGCNMAYRVSAIQDERFDERLPAYGWQEDVDFSNRLLKRGDLVRTDAFSGVHRGTKRSRSPGKKLGYSQIANPVYLLQKGTIGRRKAYVLMLKNMIANHAKLLTPEPWVDRKGRATGNWMALIDSVRGKMDPERILTMS